MVLGSFDEGKKMVKRSLRFSGLEITYKVSIFMSLWTASPATRDIYRHFPPRLRSVRGVACVPFGGRLLQSRRGLSHLCLRLVVQKPRVMTRNWFLILLNLFLILTKFRVMVRSFLLILQRLSRKSLGRPLYLQLPPSMVVPPQWSYQS